MPDLSFEQWLTLLVTIGGPLGVIWGFLAKVYFPARQKAKELEFSEAAKQREHEREQQRRETEEAERQRDHERQIQKDKLEHEQDIDTRTKNAQALQASWREDKISELLEKDASFIREDIRESQDKIKADTSLLPHIRDDIKHIKYEQGNLRANFRMLLGIVQEIYEEHKRHNNHNQGKDS